MWISVEDSPIELTWILIEHIPNIYLYLKKLVNSDETYLFLHCLIFTYAFSGLTGSVTERISCLLIYSPNVSISEGWASPSQELRGQLGFHAWVRGSQISSAAPQAPQ